MREIFIKSVLAFLLVLNSLNAVATPYSYKAPPSGFTVIQTLLPDDTVELLSCSYDNAFYNGVKTDDVWIYKELNNCAPQLTDMNLKIQDFNFSKSKSVLEASMDFLFIVMAAGLVGSAGIVFFSAAPLGLIPGLPALVGFSVGTVWTVIGSLVVDDLTASEDELKEAIHEKNLVVEKPLILVFETEEDREDFLNRVRSAVEKARSSYKHQPIQPSAYP